jgi:hypothetical protein
MGLAKLGRLSCDRWINFVLQFVFQLSRLSSSCRVCLPVVAFVLQFVLQNLYSLSNKMSSNCLTVVALSYTVVALSLQCHVCLIVGFVDCYAGTKGNRCNCMSTSLTLGYGCTVSFNRCPSLGTALRVVYGAIRSLTRRRVRSSTSMINNVEAVTPRKIILVTTIDLHRTVVQYDVSYTRADRVHPPHQEKRCRPGRPKPTEWTASKRRRTAMNIS